MEEDINSILQGNYTAIAKELMPDEKLMEPRPIVKRNVCYICGSILFDDKGRVLLVQEAKPSCHGQWYLPAGRLEPGETIVSGAKREVKEESGLECDLTTLVCVELNGAWIRFTFTGHVTGGSLKTLAEKDSESLQAKFFHPDELPEDIRPSKMRNVQSDPHATSQQGSCVLRSKDILKLIHLVRKWREVRSHGLLLPVIHPHKYIAYRFVMVGRNTGDTMHMLARMVEGRSHIPVQFVVNASVNWLAHSILKESFVSKELPRFQVCGLLAVEHRGTGNEEDGLCITLLLNIDLVPDQSLPALKSTEYSWLPVTSSHLQTKLKEGLDLKLVPVMV